MKYETVVVNKASELVELLETHGSVKSIDWENPRYNKFAMGDGLNGFKYILIDSVQGDEYKWNKFPIEVQIPKKPDWHDAICINKPVACRVWDTVNDRYRVFVCEYDSAREVYIDDSGSEWYYAEPLKADEITIWQEEPVDDGWIEWRGGECPVDPNAEVKVRLRDGTEFVDRDQERELRWSHRGWGGDIVYYKVIKD